jgi:hypothetical protein
MTNDETRMTNQIRMTNVRMTKRGAMRLHSQPRRPRCASSSWFRHSSFVIRVSCLIVLALPAATRADTYHTPLDPAAHKGALLGTVVPATGLQTVVAVEPFELKAYQAEVDPVTGQFAFRGLPPGEYDLLIKVVGHAYEGMTLDTGEEVPLSGDNLQKVGADIRKLFFESEDYFNIKKLVRLTTAAERGRLFAVQTRTLPVLEPSGETLRAWVRRFDIVDCVKTRKVWQLPTSRHILRQEVPFGDPDAKLEVHSSPKLSGFLVGEQAKNIGEIHLAKLPPYPATSYLNGDYTAK